MYSKQKNNEKAQIVKRTWLTYVKTVTITDFSSNEQAAQISHLATSILKILLIGLIAIEVTYLIYRSVKSSEVEIYPVYYTTPSILLVTNVRLPSFLRSRVGNFNLIF